jgi:hypothetical protein
MWTPAILVDLHFQRQTIGGRVGEELPTIDRKKEIQEKKIADSNPKTLPANLRKSSND